VEKLRVLDLFSGLGGFSLGLERAGMETIAFCEHDDFCKKILKKHWPTKLIFDDINDLSFDSELGLLKCKNQSYQYPRIDVLCGGFPCQDISIAGKKEGLDGKKSGLWSQYKRLIKEIKPKYAIIENVSNLRAKGLSEILKDLWEIGYDCEWHIIPASAVGAFHFRERIWIIAYAKKHREETCIKSTRLFGPNWFAKTSNSNDLRRWSSFASEEKSSWWWPKATAHFSREFKKIREIEPTICRGNDGISRGLDKVRRKRIEVLGNALVPQIVELIGKQICEIEFCNNKTKNLVR